MLFCYTIGRMHQWYRTTAEREMAYRDGYDTATKSLFSTAALMSKNLAKMTPVRGAATVVSLPEPGTEPSPARKPSPGRRARPPRHRAEDVERTRVWDGKMSA